MKSETVRVRGAEMAVFPLDDDSARGGGIQLVWAHGWGHTHRNLLPLAEAMQGQAASVLIDFPGFGKSPLPPADWGTEDYADAAAEWLAALPPQRRIWVGHSFGCRVGLRLAARHPAAIDALFLIAPAGLPAQRSLAAQARMALRRSAYQLARSLTPEGPARDRLRAHFGSADYRNAGPLRPILVKAVTENLTEVARAVRCPVALVCGDRDRETPPELATRFHRLIAGSQLFLLRGFDHWSVLTDGRHQIAHRLTEFMEQFA